MEKQEHWKVDRQGNLKGVWGLDLKKAKGDLWTQIDQVIIEWAKVHPIEMAEHMIHVHDLNKRQDNEFASSEKGLRYGVEVPVGLGIQLQLIEPELFTNKTLLHRFMKRYKGFTVCARV